MNATQFLAKLSSSKVSTGTWCVFVPISDTVGMKLYHEQEFRDDTKALQELGHETECAPKAWGSFCMEIEEEELISLAGIPCVPTGWQHDGHVWGYFTEIVHVASYYDCTDDCIELRKRMIKAGFRTSDVGAFNSGYLPNGKYVCHDWDIAHNDPQESLDISS